MIPHNLPFPKKHGLSNVKKYKLTETLFVEDFQIPFGTEISLYQTDNFGIISIPDNTKDVRGFVIQRRLFRIA